MTYLIKYVFQIKGGITINVGASVKIKKTCVS